MLLKQSAEARQAMDADAGLTNGLGGPATASKQTPWRCGDGVLRVL
jgi:hypothetical protein